MNLRARLPRLGVDTFHESQELLMPVTAMTVPHHRARRGIERREQRGGAVPHVIMGATLGLPRTHRQQWLRAIQGLHLRLLVHAQDDCPLRRVEIQPNDVTHLVDELRIGGLGFLDALFPPHCHDYTDVLVNAAALTDRGTILDTTPELFDRMFAVNVRAPFFLMQDAAKIMRRTGRGGTIVNILSTSAYGGQPFLTPYSASKGALAILTRNVAYALMRDRIRVNGLNIGWMDTPGEHAIQKRAHGAEEGWLARAEAQMPTGRLLKPLEVARAIAFLASDESGMMTGALVDFDQSVQGAGDPPRPSERLAG